MPAPTPPASTLPATVVSKSINMANNSWSGQWKGKVTIPKPGDWTCLNCGELVFASKEACRACGTAKGKQGFGGKYPMKPGDWICTKCKHTNFSRRNECHKCGASVLGAQRMDMKPGDWICVGCGDLVFADKNACRMCGTEKDWKEQLEKGANQPPPPVMPAAPISGGSKWDVVQGSSPQGGSQWGQGSAPQGGSQWGQDSAPQGGSQWDVTGGGSTGSTGIAALANAPSALPQDTMQALIDAMGGGIAGGCGLASAGGCDAAAAGGCDAAALGSSTITTAGGVIVQNAELGEDWAQYMALRMLEQQQPGATQALLAGGLVGGAGDILGGAGNPLQAAIDAGMAAAGCGGAPSGVGMGALQAAIDAGMGAAGCGGGDVGGWSAMLSAGAQDATWGGGVVAGSSGGVPGNSGNWFSPNPAALAIYEAAAAGGITISNNDNPICREHGKARVRTAMVENMDGTFSCLPGKECKGTGLPGGDVYVPKTLGKDQVYCSIHKKPRGILNCDEQKDGSYHCKFGQECRSGDFDGSERVKCSVHGSLRSRSALCDNGDNTYYCWPGKECRANPAQALKDKGWGGGSDRGKPY